MPKEHFHTLDGLRGVAALAVVLFHISLWTETRWYFAHGYLAVDFFFCLSGFIIALVYKERMGNGLTLKDFLVQRMIRLYPVIFIGMVLGFCFFLALSLVTKGQSFDVFDVVTAFLLNVLLIPFVGFESVFGNSLYPLNHPFWSIFFEIVINFAWAAVLWRVHAWVMFGTAVIAALIFFPFLASVNVGAGSYELLGGLLRVYVGFSAGVFVYDIYSRGIRAPAVSSWLLLVIVAGVLMLPQFESLWFDIACVIVVFPLVTFFGASAVAGKVLTSVMDGLGAISYPVYGVHRPICAVVVMILSKLALGKDTTIATYVIGMGAALTAAYLVTRYVDEPIRAHLTRLYRRAKIEKSEIVPAA